MIRWSIRTRLTFFSALATTGVLVVTGISLLNLTTRSLHADSVNAVSAAIVRAQDTYIEHHPSSRVRYSLPMAGDTVVQITNFAGTRVLAASSAILNAPVLAHVTPSLSSQSGYVPRLLTSPQRETIDRELSSGSVVVIQTPSGRALVFGWSYGSAARNSLNVLHSTVIGFFLLLLLLSTLLVWLGVGVTLAPVEAIRRRVATIAARDLAERIPVPKTQDELGRLAITVNEMLTRLENAKRSQQEFVSNASHELRSPLTTLLATIDRAADHADTANWTTVAATVQREGRRLNSLIDDLFWLARNDEDSIVMRKEEVDLDDVLHEEAERIRHLTTLKVNTNQVRPGRVWGDPALLRRAIRNVVDNASRYATTELTFALRFDGAICVIEVHDDGSGVDVATAHKYFERFVREDSSRTRASGGTGLGLTIVAEITSRHGGSAQFIPVESGSTIQLRVRRY